MYDPNWFTGGFAVLDGARQVAEPDESLRRWLGLEQGKSVTVAEFWEAIWSTQPNWRDSIFPQLDRPETFSHFDLATADADSRHWFRLLLARHEHAWFVHLTPVLPPLNELEEGVSEEFLENDAARRQLWIRLLRAEGQLNSLMQRWPGVIFHQRMDLSFQFVSPKIEELTGVPTEEWKRLPQRFWHVVHEGDSSELQQQLRQAALQQHGVTTVFRIRNVRTGRVSYVLEHREALRTQRGLLLGYEGVWLDVTRQTIAEKRLSTAAWKEALSVLTMGLAHDFSNIMAGIHSLSETYQAQVESSHPFHEGLGLIKRNSLQASQLIQRILHLHRGKVGERNYHNLNDLVRDILELVRKIVPRHIRMEQVLAPETLPVYLDAVEFQQVLINLALNAVDAMPKGGLLRFRVSRESEYPSLDHVEGRLPALPSLCVATEDEGCGISTALLSNIFDAFFTTKSLDKGSGLGLYNARLFAEKHHGALSVNSEEKKGTVIRVWLPQADFTEAERQEAPTAGPRHTLLVFGGVGTALENTAGFLRSNGYSIVTAASVDRALELLQARDYALSGVILLGSSHSNQSAISVAQAARKLQPAPKLVLQTAGCNQDEIHSNLLANVDLVLPPEFSRSEVLARLNSLWSGT